MKEHRTLIILLSAMMLTMPASVAASMTSCSFEGSDDGRPYLVQFDGHDDNAPMIYFFTPGTRVDTALLPSSNYTLKKFDSKQRIVDLAFDNSGDPSLPPTFTLRGVGDETTLIVGSHEVRGRLLCGV